MIMENKPQFYVRNPNQARFLFNPHFLNGLENFKPLRDYTYEDCKNIVGDEEKLTEIIKLWNNIM